MATSRTRHHKLTRKELKQPDEFQTLIENAEEFVLGHLQQVIVSAAIVLVAGAILLGVYYYEVHRDTVAGTQFYSALTALNQKNYKQAEAGFEKLAADEPGRDVGKLSRFYLGTAYMADANLPKARDAFVSYLSQAPKRLDLFSSLASHDLGVVYERMGEYTKAEGAYSAAAAIPGPSQAQAELDVARMRLRQGNKQGAIEAYQQFLKMHPFSEDRQTVVEALAQLGVAPQASMSASGGPSRVIVPIH
jgi:tetratricopeptide (TPR) repeat protein